MTPDRAEVMRAKTLILARLRRGKPIETGALEEVLNDDAGIPPAGRVTNAIRLPTGPQPGWKPDRDDPVVARQRNQRAARVAISELTQQGVVGERKAGAVVFPVRQGNRSWQARIQVDEPPVVQGKIALNSQEMNGLGDVDLFNADLGTLRLDPRTQRCLEEALAAHRHGMYLAAANLLGAVSEGAWYSAGEQLRGRDPQLDRALDNDRTAKVVARVCELIRRDCRPKAIAYELQAFADYLRNLRNYGIHPRERIDTTKEPAFSEAATMCLILQTHRYLVQLASAVATLTAAAEENG